ncbi:coiled-coil domain-containing protein 136-like [Drosophila nasuta]|uniref:coiled-coil domain-containing protein 136-like n=1 Tax=Drosophila nasuta TaxID=42062 RepID=UPI00295E2F95|nr:coiled-coil domain-containing protein 136-like [Drosophila nasuta]
MMTSHLAQQLQLKRTRSDATVSGLGDTDVSVEGCTVNVCMRSCISDYSVNLQAVVTSTITNSHPNFDIDIDGWAIPSNIPLADPAFNRPQRVDLLIGASLFYGLLCDGQIDLGDGLPILQKTRLGWIVAGGGDSRQQTALMAAEKVSDDSDEQQQCQRMGVANGVQCMSKQMDKLSCQEKSQTPLAETNAVPQQMQRSYEELQQQLHDSDVEWTQRQQELEHHLRHKQDQLNAAEQQVLQLQTRIRDQEAQERIKELGKELQALRTSTEMKERDLRDRLALFQDEVSAMRTSSQLCSPSNHSNSNGNHSNRLNDSSGELCRLTNDMESLRCMLDLRQAEIPTLSKQNAELQRENDDQRSLSNLSENPDDLDVLTPAHLLFGGPPTVILEPDLTMLDYNRQDGWQRVTQLQQVFWARWREEYLTLLQQRSKWRTPDRRLQVNDLVLVKDENLPLARVMALIPGKDDECRVAELKTTCGSTRRAINKLCPLPLKDDVER